MRNKILTSLLFSACASSALYAGAMGPVSAESSPAFVPFISGEGTFTWPDIKGYTINVTNLAMIKSKQQTQGWGGRLAVGALHPMTERFALSGEMGWGYYGHTNLEPRFNTSGVQVIPPAGTVGFAMDQYGFDILAGILYTQSKYDLFFKAGALFADLRTNAGMNPHSMLRGNGPGNVFTPNAVLALDVNIPQVMPEIKLGGAYHVNEHWMVNASWMHTFGGSLSLSAPQVNMGTSTVPAQIGNIALNLNNPSLNVVMFGLEYRFA